MATEEVLFPSLYEENYILRSLGSIVSQPDIALTELIANAWDAGASSVNIAIPENTGQTLYIEDDGTGMSEEEFQNRWMKLRYDRLRTQGKKVVFPDGSDKNRYAFGRNGVGRHGLFCFGNQYTVITKKDGKQMTFTVKPNTRKAVNAIMTGAKEGEKVPTFFVTKDNLDNAELKPFLEFYQMD